MTTDLRQLMASAGGPRSVARRLGISRQAVEQWKIIPATRVLDIEQMTGIPRHYLRPDIYPYEPDKLKKSKVLVSGRNKTATNPKSKVMQFDQDLSGLVPGQEQP